MYTKAIERLLDELRRLPGIGQRSAERLAFFILNSSSAQARALADAIARAKEAVISCKVCGNLSEAEVCDICSKPNRDAGAICVVEEPKDVAAIEKSDSFDGLYHVLWGSLSPLEGIGPDDIRLKELMGRLRGGKVNEVIIATNSDAEGEATALYLAQALKPFNVKVSRIAHGLPVGSRLEHQDFATLAKALEGRRQVN